MALDPKTLSLIIFSLTYLFFIFYNDKRTIVAVLASLLLLLTGILNPIEAFSAINWNVIGIFIGMLVVSSIFSESEAPACISEMIVAKLKHASTAMLAICVITGFISAFVDNVSTVLIVSPFALSLAKRLKIDPTSLMIGIAVSSNLQGTATLIGDPPSMLLGGFAKMNFGDFFFYQGRPGIFFAVQLGAIASFIILYLIFRKENRSISFSVPCKVRSWWPTAFLVSLIILLAASSFIKTDSHYISGTLCLIFGCLSLIWRSLIWKGSIMEKLKSLDWDTSVFLAMVFILVGSLTKTGWITTFAKVLSENVGNNVFIGYTIIVFFSVAASAIIDNIPFIAAMLPVASSMAVHLNMNPALFMFGLLIGACLGGNITPIGASANIVACGILKKAGHPVKFMDFIKIGLPFTLTAVLAGYLFIWYIWK